MATNNLCSKMDNDFLSASIRAVLGLTPYPPAVVSCDYLPVLGFVEPKGFYCWCLLPEHNHPCFCPF